MEIAAEMETPAPERTSEILARMARETTSATVEVDVLLDGLRERGFGVLIVLFALPNTVLPIAWVLGAPVFIFSVQLVLGLREPWLPERMRRASFNQETFTKLMDYAVRYLRLLEGMLKPRLTWLTGRIMERVIGLYMVFLTLILLVPVVPFGNALPAFGLGIMAAGLMERDGLAIIVGSLIGALGSVYVLLVLGGAWAALKAIVGF